MSRIRVQWGPVRRQGHTVGAFWDWCIQVSRGPTLIEGDAKECDRILVIDGGRIAEEGTYDELHEKGGLFAELMARQRLDV